MSVAILEMVAMVVAVIIMMIITKETLTEAKGARADLLSLP